jgi:hypothetical protein
MDVNENMQNPYSIPVENPAPPEVEPAAATPPATTLSPAIPSEIDLVAMTKNDLLKLKSDLVAMLPAVEGQLKAIEEKAIEEAKAAEAEIEQGVKYVEDSLIKKYGTAGAHIIEIIALGVVLGKLFGVI